MIFYILRDGEPVAKLEGYTPASANTYSYADYMAIGAHRYRVRMVDDNDNFTDSPELELTTTVRQTTVAPAARPQDMLTLAVKAGGRPERTGSFTLLSSSANFDGRRYPAVTFSGFATRQWTMTHSADAATYELLEGMIDAAQPLVVRNSYCKCIIGTVGAISPAYTPFYVDFTLSVDQCDYIEAVDYD